MDNNLQGKNTLGAGEMALTALAEDHCQLSLSPAYRSNVSSQLVLPPCLCSVIMDTDL